MHSQTIPAPIMRRNSSGLSPGKKYGAARAFYLTILIISAFTLWRCCVSGEGAQTFQADSGLRLRRNAISPSDGYSYQVEKHGPKAAHCRLVHSAEDQCAHVRANCPDEEAGLFSYLQLYYCNLHNAKPVAFIIMVLWLGLLFSTIGIAASDFFCINLSTLASVLGMSESMAGVTFLAFGNGSPDVFSTFAAMKTHSGSLAVGELIGAAGFITAVVAGSMALVRPFKVARKSFVRDVGFFIVAASFSMVFLADGRLQLWECVVMVTFYVFYVIIVVVWHWYLRRRSRRKLEDIAARSHFLIPGADEGTPEPYQDEEDEGPGARSRRSTRTISADDFANLERAGSPAPISLEEVDEDNETRDRYMAEISNNMRLSRPRRGGRRNTLNPIRPSLVGALEFRAVLSSLHKSSHLQTTPINLRLYSDDPTYTAAQQQDAVSLSSDPETHYSDMDAHDLASNPETRKDADSTGPNRIRAVSTSDIDGLRLDPSALQKYRVPQIDLFRETPPTSSKMPPPGATEAGDGIAAQSPGLPSLVTPQPGDYGLLSSSPLPMSPALSPTERRPSAGLLAPPGGLPVSSDRSGQDRSPTQFLTPTSPHGSPKLSGQPRKLRLHIPHGSMSSQRSSPLSPFPAYQNDPNFVPSSSRTPSIRLPPPSLGSESMTYFPEPEAKPLRWWPYKILPTPQVLISTLFPTLYSWDDKTIWEKMLGVVAAPSVFLLAITLPIVEVDKDDEELETLNPDPDLLPPDASHSRSRGSTLAVLPPDTPPQTSTPKAGSPPKSATNGHPPLTSPAINITSPNDLTPPPIPPLPTPLQTNQAAPSPKSWNRWLVATQLFMSPTLLVLLYWANTTPTQPSLLPLPLLIALLTSLVLTTFLLLLTHPTSPPKHRHLLCYLGFLVSIAWISTLAGEVVGLLKALGTILNISDAILGLTVFAVGNSLGDLVADITVARLGYPVMALSACFGGPMLNILLGIGLGGCYMTVRGRERREERHPGGEEGFRPYEVEVGGSLLVSGVVLLVTLLGLLVVVPMRGWWMDRRVGGGLVVLWVVSTLGNVLVEVMGWGRG